MPCNAHTGLEVIQVAVVGQAIRGREDYMAGWIMSIIGAILLLILYRMMFGKK